MSLLLSLLAAIALLVWATHDVRATVLQLFGTRLRHWIGRATGHPAGAFAAGLGVTALLQSSTATALIAAGFVDQGLLALPTALLVMLGADVGTSLMAALLSLDLSWLSPLLILVGAVLSVARPERPAGRLGRLLVGLGLLLLSLKLINAATAAATHSPLLTGLLQALHGDLLLAVALGAALTVAVYSSLAVVLLTATLAAGGLALPTAVALVLGANLGSGLLAVLTTASARPQTRQLPLGNLLFKCGGVLLVLAAMRVLLPLLPSLSGAPPALLVVGVHLAFNLLVAALFAGFTRPVAALVARLMPAPAEASAAAGRRRSHLDPAALATPSLAMSGATREVMHQAEVVETMLAGLHRFVQGEDPAQSTRLRRMDDTVDALCSSIKRYLTQLPREGLSAAEQRRWSEIVGFSIMLEQVADIVERILQDVEEKIVRQGRRFSDEGRSEICELHRRLVDNMRLATAVFLSHDRQDARRLLDEKACFRSLERAYAGRHLDRLAGNRPESVQTSGLHIDLLAELRRINSHLCSIGYPVLESG
jgi:phosphate:Na+ symporter